MTTDKSKPLDVEPVKLNQAELRRKLQQPRPASTLSEQISATQALTLLELGATEQAIEHCRKFDL